ncbi:hypothetical protein YC2023_083656 [Brassica napus]
MAVVQVRHGFALCLSPDWSIDVLCLSLSSCAAPSSSSLAAHFSLVVLVFKLANGLQRKHSILSVMSGNKESCTVGICVYTENKIDSYTQYSQERTSDKIREFASIYRSFTYVTGANYKRNVSDEDKQLEVKKEVDVKQYSGVELIIKSGFGSTLPSKDDLIRTYEKFGALDKERSCTFENDSCARVSFLNVSEGEEAFYESLEKYPFATTSTVTLKLKYPSSENRKGMMEMEWLKKKLEEMRALLDESEGGEITEELKMRLEEESRNLLDKKRACVNFDEISRPVDSGLSHKNALERCVEHSKDESVTQGVVVHGQQEKQAYTQVEIISNSMCHVDPSRTRDVIEVLEEATPMPEEVELVMVATRMGDMNLMIIPVETVTRGATTTAEEWDVVVEMAIHTTTTETLTSLLRLSFYKALSLVWNF